MNAGFETLAGYLLFRLGHIPAVGENIEFENRRFEVTQMERNRIAQVRITRITAPPPPPPDAAVAADETAETRP